MIHDLDLEEVVSGAERAALFGPAGQGAVADRIRIGSFEPAARFGVVDVAGRSQAALNDVARTFRQYLAQFLFSEVVLAALADPCRHLAEELFNQLAQVRLDVPVEKIGAHQTYAAVNVITDAARRNDAPFVWVRGAAPA